MMLDLANTAVARGKLYVARQRGEAIPEGWAIDERGRATTDPEAGIAGTILPMAGHKGYAIAVMMDVLSGVLSGSAFGDAVVGPYRADARSGAGHLAIAIDIAACRPLAAFEADMEALIRELKATPRAAGVEEILYPGEPEARAAERAAVHGVALPEATVDELNATRDASGWPNSRESRASPTEPPRLWAVAAGGAIGTAARAGLVWLLADAGRRLPRRRVRGQRGRGAGARLARGPLGAPCGRLGMAPPLLRHRPVGLVHHLLHVGPRRGRPRRSAALGGARLRAGERRRRLGRRGVGWSLGRSRP
jgi:hypothetical protein